MGNEYPDRTDINSQGVSPFTEREVAQRIERYGATHLAGKSSETKGTYLRCLTAFLDWISLQGGRCNLDHADIAMYRVFLAEERGILPASLATYLTALRSFCEYLTMIGVLRYNPVKGVKGHSKPLRHSRAVLTHEEVNRLIDSIDETQPAGRRDLAIIHLMAYAGLSGVEVVRADVQDLEVTLYGPFLHVQGKGRSKKDQRIPLDTAVMQALENHLTTRRSDHPLDPLFVSLSIGCRNVRLSTRGLRSCLHQRLVQADLKREGISAHSLTYAAPLIWLNQGMAMEEVYTRMRHGTRATTLIHARKLGLVAPL